MNPTRIPKEVLLPDGARQDIQVTKGRTCILVEVAALRARLFLSTGYYSIKYSGPYHPVQSADGYRSLSVAIARLKNISKKFHILKRNSNCYERKPTRENKVYKISTHMEIILCFFPFDTFSALR